MKKNRILTESQRRQIIDDKQKAIVESFASTFNRIKRIDESKIDENDVTNSPEFNELKKKMFDFFNKPEVTNLISKELSKLSPEEKSELSKKTLGESVGNDLQSFTSIVDKAMDSVISEDMHDSIRKLGGYEPGQEPTKADKVAGKILSGFGVANIMSMGFLPALTAMASDYFGGTDIISKVTDMVGSGGGAALSVIGGMLAGGVMWKLGKILQNDRSDTIV